MRNHCWLLTSLGLLACGGGSSDAGDPLLSGSIDAEYAGETFSASFGFATPFQDGNIVGLGDNASAIHCGSEMQNNPPPGRMVVISLPAFDAGAYSNVFVQLFRNVDEFEGVGSNSGSVNITASDADSVTGDISYSFTDDQARSFSVNGTFEVIRCM